MMLAYSEGRWAYLLGEGTWEESIHPNHKLEGEDVGGKKEKGCGLGGPYLYQLDLPLMVEAYGTSEQGLHFEGHQVSGVKDYKLG